jgi:hypothetical protein
MSLTSINNHNLASATILVSQRYVDLQISDALIHARSYCEKNVKYKWGGKTGEELDCSGLVAKCYPVLTEGVDQQFEQLKAWLFLDFDLRFAEYGDVVFFCEKPHLNHVSHVGIVEDVRANQVIVIHSSQMRGGVVRDCFSLSDFLFRDTYHATAVAKMRPFLFRRVLFQEIMRISTDGS